jgi:hypothetical protein
MITWLASYPRSGNTLLRIILNDVFRVGTYSRHDDRTDIGSSPELAEAVGHQSLGGKWKERYAQMAAADEQFFVKTHDLEPGDHPCIYIVRNGMAAISSYRKYLSDFRDRQFSLEAVILGMVSRFSSWGSHLDYWNPMERKETLLLKYEDLLSASEQAIQKIERFCKVERKSAWTNNFARLHQLDPRFFRKGQMQVTRSEWSPSEISLFYALHGDWMQKLEYETAAGLDSRDYKTLRQALAAENEVLQSTRARLTAAEAALERMKIKLRSRSQLPRSHKFGERTPSGPGRKKSAGFCGGSP